MIEEMPNPATQGPRMMIYAIVMAVVTGFGYITAVIAVIQDVEAAISAPQVLLEIYYQATQNKAGSICLMMYPLISFVICAIDDMATSARMAYALARDGGMPFNRHFQRVSPDYGVPVAGLFWCFAWDVVFGLIFLGSNNAFNAIISAAVVCFTITYAIPPGINMLRGRRMLPKSRSFKLPETIGYICNASSVLWAALTTVLFVWPTSNPTNAVNMNYCIVAFGVIIVIAGSNWIFGARKTYSPPALTFDCDHAIAAIDGQGPVSENKGDSPEAHCLETP
jgi:amino acid transporter